MASSEPHQDYQKVLTEHFYMFTKYIVADDFVVKLISDGVLNLDDKDVILNPYTCQSRRERAAKLIEILHGRGPNGYSKFLEILEYQYPHVFRDVTKQEPRSPPKGFHRNRASDQLKLIDDLPRLAQHIKDQHLTNTKLQEELTVLQQLLEFSKEENGALERDIDALKHVRQKNEDLMSKLSNMENHNKELLTDINKEMTRTLRVIEERDEYREKCQNLQLQYDALYNKVKELEKDKTTSKAGKEAAREQTPPRPASIKPVQNIDVNLASHKLAERSILRDELESYKSHSQEQSYRLQESEDNVRILEKKLDKKTKELNKQTKENRCLYDQLKDAKKMSDTYYQLIHNKDEEIILLNHQKMSEQERVGKLTAEKNEIFKEKHQLGVKLEQLRSELDMIKARMSGSNLDISCVESGSDEDLLRSKPDDEEEVEEEEEDDVRRQCRKRSVPGRYGSNRQDSAESAACCNNRTNLSVMADVDSCDMYKYSTLPTTSNETPEMVFQREIAIFRYSRRDTSPRHHHPLVSQASQASLTTHAGSVYYKPPSPRESNVNVGSVHYKPPSPRESAANVGSMHYIPRESEVAVHQQRGHDLPVAEFRDQSDKASDSTVYQPRQCGQSAFQGHQLEESVREDVESLPGSEGASSGSSRCCSLVDDLPPYDLRTELIPKPVTQVTRNGAPDSLSYRTVTVKFPILYDGQLKGAIEIVGGNHTGIFVKKAFGKTVDLVEGEEIKAIVYTPNDRAAPIETTLQGCTLEDAFRLFSEEYIRPRKEREAKLKVRKCRLEYDSACKWMGENKGTGDFLFIRCNVNMERRLSDDTVTPKMGEIFQVKNSRYSKKQWLGYRVNENTGSIDKTELKIPNSVEAGLRRVHSMNRSMSDDGRRPAIRVKGVTYERVIPMKASVKLPVHVIGHQLVVSALLDLVAKQLSTDFQVKSSEAGICSDGSDLSRNDIHIVKSLSIDKLAAVKPYQRILVFVNVTDDIDPEICSHMLGEDIGNIISREVTGTSKTLRKSLTESGHKFEELNLRDIKTQVKLLDTFVRCVSCSQSRTLWLSSSEMDPQVANMYPRYLGQNCDLSNIMAALQRAQSLDNS